jgi:hypothetical protein
VSQKVLVEHGRRYQPLRTMRRGHEQREKESSRGVYRLLRWLTMDMEETSTPADFLDHEPGKSEKAEVSSSYGSVAADTY